MTTPNTDPLVEQIARELYRHDYPTRIGGWDNARKLEKERYADRAAAVLPIVDAAVKAGKAEALEQFIRFAERHKDDALNRNASDDEVYRWATVFTTAWNYRVQETPDEH